MLKTCVTFMFCQTMCIYRSSMEKIASYLKQWISLSEDDQVLLSKTFTLTQLPAKSTFIKIGKKETYLYFLTAGIVKGWKNKGGKIVIEHLVEAGNFIASMESLFNEVPSLDTFETVTDCELYKVSKKSLELLKESDNKWNSLIEQVVSESLSCKMERLNDFQLLTAKERYLKFVDQTPDLALNVPVEVIASYLGIAPQSLSRIRGQIN